MGKKTVRCPVCSNPVKPKNLPAHIENVHSPEAETNRRERQAKERSLAKQKAKERRRELVKCKKCAIKLMRKDMKKHMREAHGILPGSLRLISRRGSRVEGPKDCSACNKSKSPVWRYSESSRGSVFICAACKPRLFDRSFGTKDVMDYAITGGAFESSRRRH